MSDACDRVLRALDEGAALDEGQRAHARSCPTCGALVAAQHAVEGIVAPVGDALDPPAALRDQVAASLAPMPRRRPLRRALLPVALAAGLVLALWRLAPRADLAHQPPSRLAVALAAGALGMGTGLAALLARGRFGVGPSAHLRAAWLAVAVVAFEGASAWSTVAVEGSVTPTGARALARMARCALEGSALALLVGAALVFAARRTAVASPASAGLVAGAAAGFAGALAQQVACPVAVHSHTMTAHAAPVLLGALVGALAGRRWLRV